jgi:hypothetical protein
MKMPHPVFLDGAWSVTGFRRYYLMTVLYKLPHVTQALFALSLLGTAFGIGGPRRLRDVATLLLPVVVLLLVASGEGMQLGVRYVLPILPFMMILAGRAANFLPARWSAVRWLAGVLVVIACGLSLRSHPHHLPYFNELAGGASGGRFHLLDSNLDWGQDLYLVQAREQQPHPSGKLRLAYFGTLDPHVLGLDYDLPPSWMPAPGRYAVSVNSVMGRPHVLTQPDGSSRSTDFQEWGYFRFFTPTATLGGSIDLYELSEADVERWRDAAREHQKSAALPTR